MRRTQRSGRSARSARKADPGAMQVYCCGSGTGVFVAKTVDALDDIQLKRFRVSMKRPAFERAPSTTTAT